MIHFSVFTHGECGSGLTNVSIYLASGIALQRYTVDLITLDTSRDELIQFYHHVDGIHLVNIYKLGVKHARACVPALVKYYLSRKPDVIFSQLTYINAIAIIAKYISFSRTINILLEGTIISKVGEVDSKENLKLGFVPYLVRIFYPYAEGLIAKSSDILSDLNKVIGSRLDIVKTKILPNPYDIERFKSLAREDVEHPWLADITTPVIISVGRLSAQKAFDVLIKSFASVQCEVACRLIILGEGPKRAELEELIAAMGLTDVIDMPGWYANPWKYMARSTFFVLPSRWEGWPSALMEAMACGLPVITTSCPGGGKEIVKDGQNGLIVPVDDVIALKSAMLSLLRESELRAQFSLEAYKLVNQYGYRVISQEYITFAESLLHPSK